MFVQLWPGSWLHRDEMLFTNDYFTIHGIWPQDDDGTWPEYCHISHPFNPNLINSLSYNLTKYWTDFKNAEHFWQHEWNKHGRCAMSDNIFTDEYDFFLTGLELHRTYDLWNIFYQGGITPSNTVHYNTTTVVQLLDDIFGVKVVVMCDSDAILGEIHLCLDKNLNPFNCPPNMLNETCQSSYIIMNEV